MLSEAKHLKVAALLTVSLTNTAYQCRSQFATHNPGLSTDNRQLPSLALPRPNALCYGCSGRA